MQRFIEVLIRAKMEKNVGGLGGVYPLNLYVCCSFTWVSDSKELEDTGNVVEHRQGVFHDE